MPRSQRWEISDDCASPVDALNEHGLEAYTDVVAGFELAEVGPDALYQLHEELRRRALQQADHAFGLM